MKDVKSLKGEIESLKKELKEQKTKLEKKEKLIKFALARIQFHIEPGRLNRSGLELLCAVMYEDKEDWTNVIECCEAGLELYAGGSQQLVDELVDELRKAIKAVDDKNLSWDDNLGKDPNKTILILLDVLKKIKNDDWD